MMNVEVLDPVKIRESLNFVDLLPFRGDCAVAIEVCFAFRDYASFKTIFGNWIIAGDN